jgi:DivIVA domain-containing protein
LELPAGRFTADDVDGLHFSLGLRGYRMDEVDQVLDRISGELRSRDAEVALLREQVAGRMRGTLPTGDDDVPDDADDSAAGSGGFGTATADRAAAPDAREP